MGSARDPSFVPSMKGIGFVPLVERLHGHIEAGKLCKADLERKLEATDRELLEARIGPTLWYPIASYERMLRLLRDREGAAGNDFFVAFGTDTAADSLGTGPIQILLKGAKAFGARAGIALIKLSKLYFNFSEWHFEGNDLEQFVIEVTDAADFPEPCRYSTLGFMQYLVLEFTGEAVQLSSQRPTRDRIVYRTG